MPASKRPKPIYQRGDFRLYARDGRENLEIVWYDTNAGRERSASAGTSDRAAAKLKLDRRYLEATGHKVCGECGRPFDGDASPLLIRAITDYLLLSQEKKGYKATRSRLAHAIEYAAVTDPAVTCAQITLQWVEGFRKWLAARPVVAPKSGQSRQRSLGHIEGCVLQLAAAINATPGQSAQFKNEQPKAVANSPKYRADVAMLAAMFRHCLEPKGRSDKERAVRRRERAELLKYLRAAVATWARPEEIFDLGPGQWTPSAGVLDLNPPGRRQTRKYRTTIAVPRQFAPYLTEMSGQYMGVSLIRGPWAGMRAAIGLLQVRGEAGEKLIRRSMATLVRRMIGEAQFRQVEMMLGHVKAGVSDIYALRDPANLGLALGATESIIEQIEMLCPGAFYRTDTANRASLKIVEGGKSG